MHALKGILLINLGSPKSPSNKDVYEYLKEFLTDDRVIDLPWIRRQLLVRGVIIPRRYKSSAASYRKIWNERGAPLIDYGYQVQKLLQNSLGNEYRVFLAMRYQEPSIFNVLQEMQSLNLKEIVVLPLFPQYASATTGSIHQRVMEEIKHWQIIPNLRFINSYPTLPELIQVIAENARNFPLCEYDHFVLSFHGLPERHIRKADKSNECLNSSGCCGVFSSKNLFCYRAQCFATARAIIQALDLPSDHCSVTFQSRLGKEPWLTPYTSDKIEELASRGAKKVLVFSPAFVADCLETLFEISIEYAEDFKMWGGETLDLVPSLNAHPLWIQGLKSLVLGDCHSPI